METKLKFYSLLSLKEISLRRVAALLWCESNVFAAISKLEGLIDETVWQTIEDAVLAKVSKLNLPKVLTKQVLALVQPAGVEIRRWKKFHEGRLSIFNEERCGLPGSTKLFWTNAGKIDYAKTVERLRCYGVDVERHYRIACWYCVEDCITPLWEKLPKKAKEHFSNEGRISRDLCYQWPHILRGDFSKLEDWARKESGQTFNQYLFEDSINDNNRSAAEYFSSKLTQEEREASLSRALNKLLGYFLENGRARFWQSEVFLYLLTLMPHEQQMRLLGGFPLLAFLCFLDPVWPDLFSENASLLWSHLPRSDYDSLMRRVEERYIYMNSLSPHWFGEILKQSPLDFKTFLVEEEDGLRKTPACRLLSLFITNRDSEFAKVLFRNLDGVDRVSVVFDREVVPLFFLNIVCRNRVRVVKACLREAKLSEGERERLKERLLAVCYGREQMLEIERVFHFLDESDASADE